MKKKPPPPSRMVNVWRAHPVITLGSIATVVSIIISLGPVLLWAANYYQTVEDAKRHQANDARRFAFGTLQGLKNETVLLRNRVNDCDITTDKQKQMTELEQKACAQYRAELGDAQQRFEAARATAMETTKER